MIIRPVKLEDACDILAIYRLYIEGSVVSFEYQTPSVSEIKRRISLVMKKYPWIVALNNNHVIGYAYAAEFRTREAYQYKCEVSVYVADSAKGKGVAKALYDDLLETLRKMGMVAAIAGMTVPNPETERFHEKYGFKKIAEYPKVGFKNGAWHNVAFAELQLNEYTNEPKIRWVNEV